MDAETSTKACNVEGFDPLTRKSMFNITDGVTFKKSVTGELSAVEPKVGLKKGSTVLKVKGKAFGTVKTDVKVFVGENECTVSACTDTEITCSTTANTGDSAQTGESVSVIKGNQLIKNDKVKMTEVELWSDKDTWGGESIPQKGEEIIIESGKNILID